MDIDVLVSSLAKEERVSLAPFVKLRAEYFALLAKITDAILTKYGRGKPKKSQTKQISEREIDKLIKKNVSNTLQCIEKIIIKYPRREYPLVLKASVLVTHPLNKEDFLKGRNILLQLIKKKTRNPVPYELYIEHVAPIKKKRTLLKKYSERLSLNVQKNIMESIRKSENELSEKKKDEEFKEFDKMFDQFRNLIGMKMGDLLHFETKNHLISFVKGEIENWTVEINKSYKKCIKKIDRLIKKYPDSMAANSKRVLQASAYGKVSMGKSHVEELRLYLQRKLRTSNDPHFRRTYLNIVMDSNKKNKRQVLEKTKDILSSTEYEQYKNNLNS